MRGATVAAAIAGCVWLLPLLSGCVGQDYFLSRNVIPAVVPLAVLLGAACVVPRLRAARRAFAVVLVAMFAYATIQVQTHAYLQRPDWRSVARALGPATVPRAIIAANGFTADPLKIYLGSAIWVQPQSQRVLVQEIDVVGDRKQLRLRPVRIVLPKQPPIWFTPRARRRRPWWRRRARGCVDRFVVRNWIIGRFVLDRPRGLSVKQLIALAPEYFHRTPKAAHGCDLRGSSPSSADIREAKSLVCSRPSDACLAANSWARSSRVESSRTPLLIDSVCHCASCQLSTGCVAPAGIAHTPVGPKSYPTNDVGMLI